MNAARLSLGSLGLCALIASCTPFHRNQVAWIDGSSDAVNGGRSTLNVRWSRTIGEGGAYIPVENASTAFDHVRDRLYVGSSDGQFLALDSRGRRYFEYDPEAGVEAAPAVDTRRGEVYVAAEDGRVHALTFTGEVLWVGSAGGTVRQSPLLEEDVIYIAREDDAVVAMDRTNGEVFWTYRRDGNVEFSVSGHAGLAATDDAIITGFSDGTVVALDRTDGTIRWQRVTAVDVEPEEGTARQFFDVDSTPSCSTGVVSTSK
ncbi:MAG: PQQ-binding-like beta-propeller repeat protein, partial [Myxococcota bacterium]